MNRPPDSSILKLLEARHPVAFFYNGIGDHLLSLPAVRALAALFPNRLRLVCVPSAAASFFATVPVQSFVETEIWRINGIRYFSADALARRIGRCDLFISLAPWHVEAIDLLLSLIDPTHSIGFSPVFDDVLLNDARRHSADVAFEVPRRLEENLRIEEFSTPPPLPAEATLAAVSIRDSLPARVRLLVIHADTSPEKMWGIKKWRMFLDFILNRYETLVVFVVGLSRAIEDEGWSEDRVFRFYGYSLSASFALIRTADLFVGIDSCMLHAADLFRVPGVGLFGPTSAEKWGFRFGPGRHVQGDGTMDSITVDQVICAFEQLLNDLEEGSQRPSEKQASLSVTSCDIPQPNFWLKLKTSPNKIALREDKKMDSTEPENKAIADRITRIRETFAAARGSSEATQENTTLSDFENFVKWEPAFDNSPWHNFGNLSGGS